MRSAINPGFTLEKKMLLPGQLCLLVLFFLPLAMVVGYSFLTRGPYGGVTGPWTADAYTRAGDPLYLQILWRSIWVAGLSTALCLLLGFPLAFYVARYARRKTLLLTLLALPFWTSMLIRTYAWMFLLRDTGLMNTALLTMGLIREPFPLLFNTGAVVLGLVYTYLPFLIFPVYATLEKLDFTLLDAAEDLGATPLTAAWRIAVPLAKPGIVAGCVLVFIPCLGAYLIPDLMGGGKSMLLGNLVANQFGAARDWPFGAAIASAFLLIALAASLWLRRRGEELL